jgi:hypothetical protein
MLSAGLTGVGGLVTAVYDYQKGDFKGASPVVAVTSGGSGRASLTFQGMKATYELRIHVFVLYTDGDAWNEDDAEDRLDDIEQKIADLIEANQTTDNWQAISYAERSACDSVEIGGDEYRRETITVIVG